MLSRYLKIFFKAPSKPGFFGPAVSYKFSLIEQFLKKGKKTPQQAEAPETPDESLIPKKILEEAKQKAAAESQKVQVSTEVQAKKEAEEKELTVEEKTTALQKEIDIELDLPYKLYGNIAKAERKVKKNLLYLMCSRDIWVIESLLTIKFPRPL